MYKMRYRVDVKLISPQGAEAEGDADDVSLLSVGDVDTVQNNDGTYTNPTGPIITSLSGAVSAVMGVNRRIQGGLKTNVRFEVWGRPVGAAEPGNTDLTADQKEERLYIQGDTPNAGLLFAIGRANRKPQTAQGGFIPADSQPEVGIVPAEPIGGG